MTAHRPAPQTPAPAPHAEEERILTPGQAARLFRVETRTVAQWADDGKIDSFRTPGGVRRYYADEIEELLRRNRRKR